MCVLKSHKRNKKVQSKKRHVSSPTAAVPVPKVTQRALPRNVHVHVHADGDRLMSMHMTTLKIIQFVLTSVNEEKTFDKKSHDKSPALSNEFVA